MTRAPSASTVGQTPPATKSSREEPKKRPWIDDAPKQYGNGLSSKKSKIQSSIATPDNAEPRGFTSSLECCPNCGHNLNPLEQPARENKDGNVSKNETYNVIELDEDSDEEFLTGQENSATGSNPNHGETPTVSGNENTPVKRNDRKGLKEGEQIGEARKPWAGLLIFRSERYQVFNWNRDKNLTIAHPGPFKGDYRLYDDFKLLTGPLTGPGRKNVPRERIPKQCVRLDDRWVGYVSLLYSKKELSENWPGEFDTNGMLRATRVPLGKPCLIWVTAGHKDVNDQAAEVDGLYYGWYRGLQPLYGDENFDAYLVRPAHGALLCSNLGFKVSCPAEGREERANFETAMASGRTSVRIKDE